MSVPSRIPVFRLPSVARVTIRGRHYRPIASNDFGHVLAAEDDPGFTQEISHLEYNTERKRSDFRYDQDYYDDKSAEIRIQTGVSSILDLPDKKQKLILWRYDFCMIFMRMEEKGECTRSDASMSVAIPKIQLEMDNLISAQWPECKKPRAGTRRENSPQLPAVKAFRAQVVALERGGMRPLALMDNYGNSGRQGSRLHPVTYNLFLQHVGNFLGMPRKSAAHWHRQLDTAIYDANKGREEKGLQLLKTPHISTFYAEINQVDDFDKFAARYGLSAALKKYNAIGDGVDVVRPLQRVEMDEWLISLVTLAIETGIWEALSPAMRSRIAKERRWLCMALCARTRCVVGLRISRTNSGKTALATFQMTMLDKGIYSDAVGALTEWFMIGMAEHVVTDAGPSFRSLEFQSGVQSLGVARSFAAGEVPSLRGRAERMFKTCRTTICEYFHGYTFENVVALGDYNATENACLFKDEEAYVFVRYIVDAYHNTPHAGLKGETPANCWKRLTSLYKPNAPADKHTQRNVFGMPAIRTLGTHGIRVLTLNFNCKELHAHLRKEGPREMDIRIDPSDLGFVSVKIDRDWVGVPCAQSGMNDVPLEAWIATLEDLNRRFGREAKLAKEAVMATLREMARIAENAARRAGIAYSPVTPEQLAHAEAKVGMTLPWAEPRIVSDGNNSADLIDGVIATGAASNPHQNADDASCTQADGSERDRHDQHMDDRDSSDDYTLED